MDSFKQGKGISLITLVITIIVMLILVAIVAITAIRGGLFNYASNATVRTIIERDKEQNMANLADGLSADNLIDKYTTE